MYVQPICATTQTIYNLNTSAKVVVKDGGSLLVDNTSVLNNAIAPITVKSGGLLEFNNPQSTLFGNVKVESGGIFKTNAQTLSALPSLNTTSSPHLQLDKDSVFYTTQVLLDSTNDVGSIPCSIWNIGSPSGQTIHNLLSNVAAVNVLANALLTIDQDSTVALDQSLFLQSLSKLSNPSSQLAINGTLNVGRTASLTLGENATIQINPAAIFESNFESVADFPWFSKMHFAFNALFSTTGDFNDTAEDLGAIKATIWRIKCTTDNSTRWPDDPGQTASSVSLDGCQISTVIVDKGAFLFSTVNNPLSLLSEETLNVDGTFKVMPFSTWTLNRFTAVNAKNGTVIILPNGVLKTNRSILGPIQPSWFSPKSILTTTSVLVDSTDNLSKIRDGITWNIVLQRGMQTLRNWQVSSTPNITIVAKNKANIQLSKEQINQLTYQNIIINEGAVLDLTQENATNISGNPKVLVNPRGTLQINENSFDKLGPFLSWMEFESILRTTVPLNDDTVTLDKIPDPITWRVGSRVSYTGSNVGQTATNLGYQTAARLSPSFWKLIVDQGAFLYADPSNHLNFGPIQTVTVDGVIEILRNALLTIEDGASVTVNSTGKLTCHTASILKTTCQTFLPKLNPTSWLQAGAVLQTDAVLSDDANGVGLIPNNVIWNVNSSNVYNPLDEEKKYQTASFACQPNVSSTTGIVRQINILPNAFLYADSTHPLRLQPHQIMTIHPLGTLKMMSGAYMAFEQNTQIVNHGSIVIGNGATLEIEDKNASRILDSGISLLPGAMLKTLKLYQDDVSSFSSFPKGIKWVIGCQNRAEDTPFFQTASEGEKHIQVSSGANLYVDFASQLIIQKGQDFTIDDGGTVTVLPRGILSFLFGSNVSMVGTGQIHMLGNSILRTSSSTINLQYWLTDQNVKSDVALSDEPLHLRGGGSTLNFNDLKKFSNRFSGARVDDSSNPTASSFMTLFSKGPYNFNASKITFNVGTSSAEPPYSDGGIFASDEYLLEQNILKIKAAVWLIRSKNRSSDSIFAALSSIARTADVVERGFCCKADISDENWQTLIPYFQAYWNDLGFPDNISYQTALFYTKDVQSGFCLGNNTDIKTIIVDEGSTLATQKNTFMSIEPLNSALRFERHNLVLTLNANQHLIVNGTLDFYNCSVTDPLQSFAKNGATVSINGTVILRNWIWSQVILNLSTDTRERLTQMQGIFEKDSRTNYFSILGLNSNKNFNNYPLGLDFEDFKLGSTLETRCNITYDDSAKSDTYDPTTNALVSHGLDPVNVNGTPQNAIQATFAIPSGVLWKIMGSYQALPPINPIERHIPGLHPEKSGLLNSGFEYLGSSLYFKPDYQGNMQLITKAIVGGKINFANTNQYFSLENGSILSFFPLSQLVNYVTNSENNGTTTTYRFTGFSTAYPTNLGLYFSNGSKLIIAENAIVTYRKVALKAIQNFWIYNKWDLNGQPIMTREAEDPSPQYFDSPHHTKTIIGGNASQSVSIADGAILETYKTNFNNDPEFTEDPFSTVDQGMQSSWLKSGYIFYPRLSFMDTPSTLQTTKGLEALPKGDHYSTPDSNNLGYITNATLWIGAKQTIETLPECINIIVKNFGILILPNSNPNFVFTDSNKKYYNFNAAPDGAAKKIKQTIKVESGGQLTVPATLAGFGSGMASIDTLSILDQCVSIQSGGTLDISLPKHLDHISSWMQSGSTLISSCVLNETLVASIVDQSLALWIINAGSTAFIDNKGQTVASLHNTNLPILVKTSLFGTPNSTIHLHNVSLDKGSFLQNPPTCTLNFNGGDTLSLDDTATIVNMGTINMNAGSTLSIAENAINFISGFVKGDFTNAIKLMPGCIIQTNVALLDSIDGVGALGDQWIWNIASKQTASSLPKQLATINVLKTGSLLATRHDVFKLYAGQTLNIAAGDAGINGDFNIGGSLTTSSTQQIESVVCSIQAGAILNLPAYAALTIGQLALMSISGTIHIDENAIIVGDKIIFEKGAVLKTNALQYHLVPSYRSFDVNGSIFEQTNALFSDYSHLDPGFTEINIGLDLNNKTIDFSGGKFTKINVIANGVLNFNNITLNDNQKIYVKDGTVNSANGSDRVVTVTDATPTEEASPDLNIARGEKVYVNPLNPLTVTGDLFVNPRGLLEVLNGGVLTLNASGDLTNNGTISINDGGTLITDATDFSTISASWLKPGSILQTSENFTGSIPTGINWKISGTQTSDFSVANGQTVSGTGTITGSITVHDGGLLDMRSLTYTPANTNKVTVNANGIVQFETVPNSLASYTFNTNAFIQTTRDITSFPSMNPQAIWNIAGNQTTRLASVTNKPNTIHIVSNGSYTPQSTTDIPTAVQSGGTLVATFSDDFKLGTDTVSILSPLMKTNSTLRLLGNDTFNRLIEFPSLQVANITLDGMALEMEGAATLTCAMINILNGGTLTINNTLVTSTKNLQNITLRTGAAATLNDDVNERRLSNGATLITKEPVYDNYFCVGLIPRTVNWTIDIGNSNEQSLYSLPQTAEPQIITVTSGKILATAKAPLYLGENQALSFSDQNSGLVIEANSTAMLLGPIYLNNGISSIQCSNYGVMNLFSTPTKVFTINNILTGKNYGLINIGNSDPLEKQNMDPVLPGQPSNIKQSTVTLTNMRNYGVISITQGGILKDVTAANKGVINVAPGGQLYYTSHMAPNMFNVKNINVNGGTIILDSLTNVLPACVVMQKNSTLATLSQSFDPATVENGINWYHFGTDSWIPTKNQTLYGAITLPSFSLNAHTLTIKPVANTTTSVEKKGGLYSYNTILDAGTLTLEHSAAYIKGALLGATLNLNNKSSLFFGSENNECTFAGTITVDAEASIVGMNGNKGEYPSSACMNIITGTISANSDSTETRKLTLSNVYVQNNREQDSWDEIHIKDTVFLQASGARGGNVSLLTGEGTVFLERGSCLSIDYSNISFNKKIIVNGNAIIRAHPGNLTGIRNSNWYSVIYNTSRASFSLEPDPFNIWLYFNKGITINNGATLTIESYDDRWSS